MTTPQSMREKLVEEAKKNIYHLEATASSLDFEQGVEKVLRTALTTYGDAREAAAREEGEQDCRQLYEALRRMYDQYCPPPFTHNYMTAGENAEDILQLHAKYAITPTDYPANYCIECGEPVNESEAIKNCHGNCRIQI